MEQSGGRMDKSAGEYMDVNGSECAGNRTNANGSECASNRTNANGSECASNRTNVNGSECASNRTNANGNGYAGDHTNANGSECAGNRTNVNGSNPAGNRRPARLFIPPEAWALAEPDSAAFLKSGLDKLQSGASLQAAEAVIAPEGLKTWMDVFRELQGAEIWVTHGEWIGREQPVFGPDIAARFAWAAGLAGADHSPALALRSQIAQRLRALLGNDGCLVIPTVPGPAPLRGAAPEQLERNRSGAMMLSCMAGLAGLPQVTLPVAGPGGLPLGLSVIGGPGQDLELLSWIQEIWL
ncbi:hypothetical protein HQN87_08540 [Paenibacillus tritici]|uniref:Amidase domain-containing protein n=1 Tax=Paenibacillus tritici TaxID=1873425 RepID=A0ABX2DMB3_9BACL|nr:hypothetical protein [Paenibacillus tritici]